jgi:hypothetical protein
MKYAMVSASLDPRNSFSQLKKLLNTEDFKRKFYVVVSQIFWSLPVTISLFFGEKNGTPGICATVTLLTPSKYRGPFQQNLGTRAGTKWTTSFVSAKSRSIDITLYNYFHDLINE